MTLISERLRPALSRAALPAAVLLLAGGILTSDVSSSEAIGTHQAAASCSLNVASRVAISSPYVNPAFTLGSDCAAAGVIDARWEAKRADGVIMKKAFFNFDYPASWAVFDATSLSPWTWQPAGAVTRDDPAAAGRSPNATNASVPQNTPTTDIRMASTAALPSWSFSSGGPAPCGLNITFNAKATRYAITPHGYINYAAATGSIQHRPQGSSSWAVIANITTDANGNVSTTRGFPGPGDYRAVFYDAQYIFGNIGASTTIQGCGVGKR